MAIPWDPFVEAGVTLSSGGVPLDELWDLDDYWPAASPPPWQADALCAEPAYPQDLFFDDDNPGPAKAVCARCLVQPECLAFAQVTGINHGVFGGLSAKERRTVKRTRQRATPPSTGPKSPRCGAPKPDPSSKDSPKPSPPSWPPPTRPSPPSSDTGPQRAEGCPVSGHFFAPKI